MIDKTGSSFFQLVETIGEAIVILNDNDEILYMNRFAGRMLSCSTQDSANMKLYDLVSIENKPLDNNIHDNLFDAYVDDNRFYLINCAGVAIPITFSCTPLESDVLGLEDVSVLVLKNETLHKSMEDKLLDNYKQLRSILSGVIHAISMAVESRDPFTAQHQRKVSDLCRRIARKMGLASSIVECVRVAGLLHDLGKISIPSDILTRPGKINEIEKMMINSHVEVGHSILENIEFPWPLAEIVFQHHERIDGSGYPGGLKGDDIHLEAQIIAVADVVEAITSHRPYRPGKGIEAALYEIETMKGTLFRADIVDACLEVFSDIQFRSSF